MKKLLLLSLSVLLVGAYSSCKKSNTTVTPTGAANTAKLDYQLKTVNPSASFRTTAGTITWTSGFANPTLIKFEAKQGTTEIEYKSYNTAQIDLMASTATYFGSFSVPVGTYNEIELKFQLNSSGSTPALQLNGQFANGLVTIPVIFKADGLVELKTEQHNVTFSNNTSFTGVATLDLSGYTTGITESMLISASITGGTMIISSTSNTALYNIILNNLRNKDHHTEFEHD